MRSERREQGVEENVKGKQASDGGALVGFLVKILALTPEGLTGYRKVLRGEGTEFHTLIASNP